MLDRDLIRQHPEEVRTAIARKGLHAPVDEFLETDASWRAKRHDLDQVLAERNQFSKAIGALMAQKKLEEAEEAKAKAKVLSDRLPSLEQEVRELEAQLELIELEFPNLPHASVPDGTDESQNVVVRTWGDAPATTPPPHWEIAEKLGLLDLPRATKIAGSGFALYQGWGARLQRALGAYMIDFQTRQNGYFEIYPPYLSNAESLTGTGNLPKFEEDLYKTRDDLYLIPTAEIPLTNYYRDEILEGDSLPVRLAGFSGCFRREAGAAGKDTRGLLRIHQFDKVELVWFVHPEKSYEALETLVSHAEAILQSLGLHYRVIELCAGDLGAKGCKCYDVEVWSPGVGRFLEISSCTNFEAYQSRRAKIRYRPEPGAKPEYLHILNGSGLATPRLFAALVETYHQSDGSILIPAPLQPYIGTDRIAANE